MESVNPQPDIAQPPLVRLWRWLWYDVFGIVKEFRLSYLPPLMVYFAAGVSGFTGIIESFFVKDELGLSAAFLAGLAFWAGLPWAFKMPLGHLVDLFWKKKAIFVYIGALFMASGLVIMIGLTGYTEAMSTVMRPELWYILAALLSPVGYVLQDVVADAMTVEAVPVARTDGSRFSEKEFQRMNVTMQTLGRIAILGGSAIVAGLGGWLALTLSYKAMYLWSLLIPVISVMGVTLNSIMQRRKRSGLKKRSISAEEIDRLTAAPAQRPPVNWHILGGSALFIVVAVSLGLSSFSLRQETVLLTSLLIIAYLIAQLVKPLSPVKRREIIGIAIVIFAFRAVPSFGAGAGWWQIDVLKFDEAFFGTLRQVASLLAIAGMFALRGWMARRPVTYLIVFLSVYATIMSLPYVGLFYGLSQWTMAHFGFGARTIALVDTMADSPVGQVAMIPLLAWIAMEAPRATKATFFAVMSAFTNLALSASNLGTEYLNKLFVVPRGQYSALGPLMITAIAINLIVPIAAVILFNPAGRWNLFNLTAKLRKKFI